MGPSPSGNERTYRMPDNIEDQLSWIRNSTLHDAPAPTPVSYLRVENPITPWRRHTTLRFSLPFPTEVALDIHDLRGNRVRRLCARALAAGRYALTWFGRDDSGRRLAPGTYVVRLRAADNHPRHGTVAVLA